MDSDQNAMAGNAAMTPEHIAGEEPGPVPVASGGWAAAARPCAGRAAWSSW